MKPPLSPELRITQVNLAPGQIDLGVGQPGFDLLPLAVLRRAAAVALMAEDPACLNYGYEQGDGRFRHALAQFLTAEYGFSVAAGDLLVTNGASQGLDLICTLFTRPGDTVLVEEPTYFLALRIFADHGLRVVGIPTAHNGLDLDALEAILARHRPVLLYTIPTFQNPSGVTLPLDSRERLVALSAAHNFLIVADEVYQLLHYTVTPPPPLAYWVESGRVLSLGSFSKILAPGLRLGWIQAAAPLLARLTGSGLLDSGGGLNPFTSNVVRIALEKGWQAAHLAHLRQTYQRRLAAMAAALASHLGGIARFTVPDGGFFFWVALDEGVDTAVLLPAAHQHQTGYQPGVKFSSRGTLRHYLRLSFAFYDEATLVSGTRRLQQVFSNSLITLEPSSLAK